MEAKRDGNRITTLQGVLNSNGLTPTNIKATQSNGTLMVHDDITGSDNGPTDATRDENRSPVAMAVSESDGVTPVVIYADSSGNFLVDSN